MSSVYFYNSNEITNRAFKDVYGTSYPNNWCDLVTEEDRESVGVVTLNVLPEEYPLAPEGYYYTGLYEDDFTELTRTYLIQQIETSPEYEITTTGNAIMSGPFPENSLILCFAIKANDQTENIKIGSSLENDDFLKEDSYPQGEWKVVSVNMIVSNTIYFSGATGSVTYKIFLA